LRWVVRKKRVIRRAGTYHRTTSRFFIETVAYDKLLSFSHQGVDEFVIYSVLNIKSRSSRAVLTSVVKNTQGGPVRG